MKLKDERLWILLLTIFAFALRLWFATTSSLWLDEAFSVVESAKPLHHILTLGDNTPPLYYLVLHGWMSIFGTSALGVRSLSVVFGALLVPIVWRFAGLQAAALVAVWPSLIEYGAQTRTYSLFVLAAALHFLLARSDDERPVLGALAGLLTVLAHAYGILYLFAAQIAAWGRKGPEWYAGQVLAFSAWAAWSLFHVFSMDVGTIGWIERTGVWTIPWTWGFLTSGNTATLTGIVFSLLALLAAMFYARRLDAAWWALLPIAAAVVAGLFFPIFHPKYVLPSAVGIILLFRKMDVRLLCVLFISCIIATISLAMADRHVPWEDIARSPMQYEPEYAVYPLLYYAAPSCLGEVDHVACAHSQGLTEGCSYGTALVIDPPNPSWVASEHSVGFRQC